MGEYAFPRERRLTRTRDYRHVYRAGRKVSSRNFLLFVLPAAEGPPRVGLSASRKVGGAVVRNRVKRRMKEIVRQLRPRFRSPACVVLVAHPRTANLSYQEMERDITCLLGKAGLLDEVKG